MIDVNIKNRFRTYINNFKHIQAWGIVENHFVVNVYSKWYYKKPKIAEMFEGYDIVIFKIKKTELL